MIGEPQVVTEVPEELCDSAEEIIASEVLGLSSSGLHKRSEVALAISRQSISIYDVCI